MNFDPREINVRTLFKSLPVFNIPTFQRDYSWDKPFYERFIDDLISNIIYTDEKIELNTYFIGTMVFSGKSTDEKIDVVDGQQRLTVITILLSVLSQKFKDDNETGLADATFKYIKDIDDNNLPKRLLVSDTSYPYFDCFIQSKDKGSIPDVSSEEEQNIKETYDFFSDFLSEEKLKKTYSKFKDTEYSAILISIRDVLLMSKLIAIVTPDKNSAHMIFEILNAKGKNLASIDLIKNIIFEKLLSDKNGAHGRAEELWESTKKELMKQDNSVRLVTFYRHFWISKYKKVTTTKLYDSFKDEISPRTSERYIRFLEDMHSDSKRYVEIITPNLANYSNRKEYIWFVQSLNSFNNVFNIVQTRIALLAFLDLKDRGLISSSEFKKAITYMENFVYAYTAIAKKPANFYESRLSNLAINLRTAKNKSETNSIIKKFLYDSFDEKFPSYEEFEENFVKLAFSKKSITTNMLTKYTLNKISQLENERDFFWDNSSIEHIINEDIENNDSLNIGNLITLEENLNREADNQDYEGKKTVYSKSKYNEVQSLIKDYPSFSLDFNLERAKNLSKVYYTKIFKRKCS